MIRIMRPRSRGGCNPWLYLATQLPAWRVCLCDMPVLGALDWERLTIHLNRSLDAAGRRCTLAHEIGHIRRGDTGPCTASIEQRIEEAVARRLIPLADLVDAVRWGRHPAEVADALAVDLQILQARLNRSTEAERNAIHAVIRRLDEAA